MRILYLQHVPFEGPANITAWANDKGHSIQGFRLYQDDLWPSLDDFDLLIVLGGPMGINDALIHPWLKAEKKFILSAIRAGKSILGICLGAQLIADVLGARVYKQDEKEIGWFQVRLSDEARTISIISNFPDSIPAFHWHGETFDLPDGAIHLASSEVCKNQAFIFEDRVIGLQFHLESNEQSILALIENDHAALVPSPYVQDKSTILGSISKINAIKKLLYQLLDGIELICKLG